MKNNIYVHLCVLMLSVVSCSTNKTLVDRTKKLELGMSKKKVISVMGNDYKIISATKTKDGDLEVLLYSAPNEINPYTFYLLNGELEKWYENNTLHIPSGRPHSTNNN